MRFVYTRWGMAYESDRSEQDGSERSNSRGRIGSGGQDLQSRRTAESLRQLDEISQRRSVGHTEDSRIVSFRIDSSAQIDLPKCNSRSKQSRPNDVGSR